MQPSMVLTPVDFSENAEKIAQFAACMAGRFQVPLRFLFVVQSLEDYTGFFTPPLQMPNMEQELLRGAQDKMESFLAEHSALFSENGVTQVDGQVLSGDVGEQILRHAEEHPCCLIVMGTHGYKGLERVMFGSVADHVVKNATCPVMTINPYRSCSPCASEGGESTASCTKE
ncbi:MAG: universal stress protein [Desulfobulbaceae bacterium A2]|nr:MAG: universal stress protein [Desulfobulbaceae bacterium A2]